MMHGFQHIVTQAERGYNLVVHGLIPLGNEMAVSPLIWRKKLMDSISGNLGYIPTAANDKLLASKRIPLLKKCPQYCQKKGCVKPVLRPNWHVFCCHYGSGNPLSSGER